MYDFTHHFLPGSFERYIVVDTGNKYTITTRHHHHIFKTRPRTTFSSKLPNHNFVNIWNEIDENLKSCSSKVIFKLLLRKRYTAVYLSHVHALMLLSHCGEYPCECKKIYSRQIRQKVANIRRMGLRMQFATNRNDRKMIARHS